MTKPLPSTAPAIAAFLEQLHDLMWALDADEKSEHIRYTEEDVMHASKIFLHVLSNVAIHKMMEEKMPIEEAGEKHLEHGKAIRKIIQDMTGYDPRAFYKRGV